MTEKAEIIDLKKLVEQGTVGWVTGLGRAPHKDPLLEIAFYNNVTGDAKNPPHPHTMSTERLLIIQGGMTVKTEEETFHIGPLQMISLPPGLKHNIVSYDPGTIALNLRNSPMGAVGHLPEDRG